jgi:hypothetical protein
VPGGAAVALQQPGDCDSCTSNCSPPGCPGLPAAVSRHWAAGRLAGWSHPHFRHRATTSRNLCCTFSLLLGASCPPLPLSSWPSSYRDYCYKGEILQCCEGSKCVTGKGCVEDKPPPVCPAGCVDYQCLDLQHFCLGGHAMSCGHGTSCTGKPGPGSPCRSDHTKVACPKGDWGCTSSR